MTTVRVQFPPLGVCRVLMKTFLFITRQGRYSYLLVSESARYNYYLTLHKGQIELEKHGKESEFVKTLLPHSKCNLKHAAEIYLKSTLSKTDEAMEILDRIQFSTDDQTDFMLVKPVEREKKERLSKKERTQLKANQVTLEKLCRMNDWNPQSIRSMLRRAKVERPDGKWVWPKSKVPDIVAVIKGLLKKRG